MIRMLAVAAADQGEALGRVTFAIVALSGQRSGQAGKVP